MRHAIAILLCLSTAAVTPAVTPALAQPGPAQTALSDNDSFGPWRLACTTDAMTDRADCRLYHRDWVEPPSQGRPGLALEIADRDGRAVPIVAARDLGMEAMARGLQALTGTAQLRFPPNRLFEMPCRLEGRALVCAPRAEDTARAADEVLGADRVLLRMGGLGSGGAADPTELRLSDTAAAIARLRARQPQGAPAPAAPGLDLRDALQWLQRLVNP